MTYLLIFFVGFLAQENIILPDNSKGDIIVQMNNFKNDSGEVIVYLYNQEDGFPDEPEHAIDTIVTKITNNKATVTFGNKAYTNYALSVIHDENKNSKMDSNWIGIPIEGYAVSNNIEGSFGPPSYDDSKFALNTKRLVLDLKLIY